MSDIDDDDVDDTVGHQAGDNSQIEVYGRLRPSPKNDKTVCIMGEDHHSVEFRLPRDVAGGYINNKKETYEFKMNHIFDDKATQEDIFEGIGKKVVQNVLDGFNGTIFAYGQTGSGKTFTITGGSDRYEDRGLIPRTLSMIFAEKEARSSEYLFNISISYLEIYNDDGYDLLDAEHETKALTELPKVAMFEDDTGNIHMRNIHLLPANSVDEALNLLFVGDTNRIICETPSNDASSRSHCIFTIYVESHEVGGSRIRRSKLHLVDLAGSERIKKTQIQGKILTEALHINLALHYLEQVIVALHKRTRDKNVHIPYRNSMMTSVLRDSLGGNCKTVMIATMSGQRPHIDESISTCRFAQRVAMVRNSAFINEEVDPKLVIKRLKLQVRELKEGMASLQGQKGVDKPLDEDEIARCRAMVQDFLGSDKPTVEYGLPNKHRVYTCFMMFKEMLLQAQQGHALGDQPTIVGTAGNKSLITPTSPAGKPFLLANSGSAAQEDELKKLRLMVSSRDNEISILVAMLKQNVKSGKDIEILEEVRERAIKQARESTGIKDVHINSSASVQQSLIHSKGVKELASIHSRHTDSDTIGATAEEDSETLQQRLASFEEFRKSYRKNELIEEQKDSLKSKIEQAQRLGEAINKCRNEINHLKGKIESHRIARGAQNLNDPNAVTEPDAEEESYKNSIEQEKLAYRTHFNSLKELKTEIEQLKHMIDRSRRKLQQDFDTWWTAQNSQTNVAKTGSKEQKQAQIRAAGLAAATSGQDQFSSTGAFPVQYPSSSPSSIASSARSSAPSSVSGLISGALSVASPSPSPSPPSTTSSYRSTSNSSQASSASGQRLLSTGNAQADADIQKFYEMRDTLMKQQQQAQAAAAQRR